MLLHDGIDHVRLRPREGRDFCTVMFYERLREVVVLLQSFFDGLFRVVGPYYQRFSGLVVDALLLRRVPLDMIRTTGRDVDAPAAVDEPAEVVSKDSDGDGGQALAAGAAVERDLFRLQCARDLDCLALRCYVLAVPPLSAWHAIGSMLWSMLGPGMQRCVRPALLIAVRHGDQQ